MKPQNVVFKLRARLFSLQNRMSPTIIYKNHSTNYFLSKLYSNKIEIDKNRYGKSKCTMLLQY